ncbi:hypothetical protein MKK75_29265 [Methylobacterium sp. J-030]|uniref:hypothetical protein n=1 Tax=Methylobacterium sp. J-030 TaxID=2836627 RepID=UPI001FBA9B88|nr:hypothetical protein [Methylobacterium sp. J-030]MCJ2072836.1 hypothetical protein [Methylobacterium sp. J-030]
MQPTAGSGLRPVRVSQPALAADLPSSAKPNRDKPNRVKPNRVLPGPFTWSGAYSGLSAGGGALGERSVFTFVTGKIDGSGPPAMPGPPVESVHAAGGRQGIRNHRVRKLQPTSTVGAFGARSAPIERIRPR